MPASTAKPIRFDLYRGSERVRSTEIGEQIIKVGTAAGNHLQLDDELASRHHAMIEVDALGTVSVRDLGSRSGTFVNGRKFDVTPLHDSDELAIGATRIVVTLAPPASDAVAAPPPNPSVHGDAAPLKARVRTVGVMVAAFALVVLTIVLAR
jgi:pSer/pThr/pTyr-binding forkhead associated (FHA) protein